MPEICDGIMASNDGATSGSADLSHVSACRDWWFINAHRAWSRCSCRICECASSSASCSASTRARVTLSTPLPPSYDEESGMGVLGEVLTPLGIKIGREMEFGKGSSTRAGSLSSAVLSGVQVPLSAASGTCTW